MCPKDFPFAYDNGKGCCKFAKRTTDTDCSHPTRIVATYCPLDGVCRSHQYNNYCMIKILELSLLLSILFIASDIYWCNPGEENLATEEDLKLESNNVHKMIDDHPVEPENFLALPI